MRNQKQTPEVAQDEEELSPEFRRELRRRIADARNPIRYVVYSAIPPGSHWRLFLNVSEDSYCLNNIDDATMFKREHVARAVALVYSNGKRRDLLIAKITTRNGKRKIVRYEKRKHRTRVSS